MQSRCGQTVVSHGERIYSQMGHQYQPNVNCSVTIKGYYKGQKMFLRIEDIDIRGNADCYGDYLEIYDDTSKPTKKPHLMCGQGRRITTRITSRGDAMRLVFITDGATNGRGFRAVITALFPDKKCKDFRKFRCANGRCISSMLTCDSVNHCGDESDEKPNACSHHKVNEYRNTYRKAGDLNVVIPELIFICIGTFLVFMFFYFCIPQVFTHILLMRTKWAKLQDDQEIESGSIASSNPLSSAKSLRARPSDAAFLPVNWEIKMGELLNAGGTYGDTFSMLKNSSSRGNDDRDKVIADEVASGRKVKVGRFVVQKSIKEEENESDRSQASVDGGLSSDEGKQMSWVQRREKHIRKSIQKENVFGNQTSSSDQSSAGGSISDCDRICYEEKEALLNKHTSKPLPRQHKNASKHLPERKRVPSRALPDWDFDSDDEEAAAASNVLVRPRSVTMPFLPTNQTAPFEWDFSDDSDTSSTTSITDVIPFQDSQRPDDIRDESASRHAARSVGRFAVQTISTPEMGRRQPSSPSYEQEQNPQLDQHIKNVAAKEKISPPTKALVGKFTVQEVGENEANVIQNTGTSYNVQKHDGINVSSQDKEQTKGRFVVQNVDVNVTTGDQQQQSKKGRFTVQKVEATDPNKKTSIDNTGSTGRFKVTKVNTDLNNLNVDHSDTPNVAHSVGRFNIQKVTTPEMDTNNHPHNVKTNSESIPRNRPGTGRFVVQKVEYNDDSLKQWDYPRDDDEHKTKQILNNVQSQTAYEDATSGRSVNEVGGYLETAL
ncbi:uncharacterized protein [Amphiura filiformis]|uniref:uncharacterized protein n=1 Tax=Amphiura filiformis TaxID=82378 RepID=UPI003B22576B